MERRSRAAQSRWSADWRIGPSSPAIPAGEATSEKTEPLYSGLGEAIQPSGPEGLLRVAERTRSGCCLIAQERPDRGLLEVGFQHGHGIIEPLMQGAKPLGVRAQ